LSLSEKDAESLGVVRGVGARVAPIVVDRRERETIDDDDDDVP